MQYETLGAIAPKLLDYSNEEIEKLPKSLSDGAKLLKILKDADEQIVTKLNERIGRNDSNMRRMIAAMRPTLLECGWILESHFGHGGGYRLRYSPEEAKKSSPFNLKVKVRSIEYEGRVQSLSAWSRELGIKRPLLYSRLFDKGMSVKEAFETPVKKRSRRFPTSNKSRRHLNQS
jgi:hypothetical protein